MYWQLFFASTSGVQHDFTAYVQPQQTLDFFCSLEKIYSKYSNFSLLIYLQYFKYYHTMFFFMLMFFDCSCKQKRLFFTDKKSISVN